MSVFSNRYSDAKQEAGAYTEAVLGLIGDRDPLTILEGTSAELARLMAGLWPPISRVPKHRESGPCSR